MEVADEMSGTEDILLVDLEDIDETDVPDMLAVNSNPKYTIQETYTLNKQAQLNLKDCIANLQHQLDKNLEQQERLYSMPKVNEIKMFKSKPYRYFHPYFQDFNGLHSPSNEDAIEKKRHNYVDAYLYPPQCWNDKECATLFRVIKENARVMAAKPMTIRVAYLKEKKKKKYHRRAIIKDILAEIICLKEKIEKTRSKPFKELWNEGDIKLDWLMISCDMQRKGYDRSPESCELMWTNYLRPGINRRKFAYKEDIRLKSISNLHQQGNWDYIAKFLGTNRTALQCIERFQSTLNKYFFNRYWCPDEDQKLTEVIDFCRIGDFIPWKKVIQYMNGWSLSQIYHRWYKLAKPQSRNGPWIAQEDAVVLLASELIDKQWMSIAKFLHGRTSYACCNRYKSALDPMLITNPWSWQEDKLLLSLVAIYGEKSDVISNCLIGRSEAIVNQRCKTLKQSKPEIYEQILKSYGKGLDTLLPQEQFVVSGINDSVNDKRKEIRMKAFVYAKDAIHQVCGVQFDVSACNTFKELVLGIDTSILDEIAKLLLQTSCDESIKCKFPRYDREYIELLEEEKELNNPVFISVEEQEVMTEEEIEIMEREFDERIFSSSVIGYNQFANIQIFQKQWQEIEYDALFSQMCKAFISHGYKDSDDEVNFSDEGDWREDIEFKNTISRVVNHFILIEPTFSEFPVIPINLSTINSFIIILLIRRVMRTWMVQLSSETTDMLNTVLDCNEKELPKSCLDCEMERNEINRSIVYNANEQDQSSICAKCKGHKVIKKRLKILLNRFLLTFTLPYLLVSNKPSEHQIRKFLLKGALFHERFGRYLMKRNILRVTDVYTDDDDSSTTDDDLNDFTYRCS